MHGFHPIEAMTKHPYITGGAVLGIILAIWIFSRGGGAQVSAAPNTSASDVAAIQAAGAATNAQTAATINATNATAATTINGQNTGAAVSIAGLQAGVQTHQVDAAQTVGLATIGAQQTLGLSQIAGAVAINTNNTNAAVTINGKQVDGAITLQTLQNEHDLMTLSGNNATISALYQQYEGRKPDAAGLSYWSTQLASGMSYSDLVDRFRTADETTAHWSAINPSNPTPFVQTPAPSGLTGGGTAPAITGPVSGGTDTSASTGWWTDPAQLAAYYAV
jgi:hypothetical protein